MRKGLLAPILQFEYEPGYATYLTVHHPFPFDRAEVLPRPLQLAIGRLIALTVLLLTQLRPNAFDFAVWNIGIVAPSLSDSALMIIHYQIKLTHLFS